MSQKEKSKIYVLDTNIFLHRPGAHLTFAKNDVVVPLSVINELDKFKVGNESININARTAVNALLEIGKTGNGNMFNGGAVIGDGMGKIRIVRSYPVLGVVQQNFPSGKGFADIDIINTCLNLQKEYSGREVILVTQDRALALQAQAVNVVAEDYEAGSIELQNIDDLYSGVMEVVISDDVMAELYENSKVAKILPLENVRFPTQPVENQFLILKGSKSIMGMYKSGVLHSIQKSDMNTFKIEPRNAEQIFALMALRDPSIDVVTLVGPAGTGKTLMALIAALEQLEQKKFQQVLFTRQIIGMNNKELGYLPGSANEKTGPFMAGLYDNIGVVEEILKSQKAKVRTIPQKFIDEKKLILEILSLIRGRSIAGSMLLVDEAQNLAPFDVKTILTRAAAGTKVVLMGDPHQIDTPYLSARSNGLSHLVQRFTGQKNYAHISLVKGERSTLATQAGNLL